MVRPLQEGVVEKNNASTITLFFSTFLLILLAYILLSLLILKQLALFLILFCMRENTPYVAEENTSLVSESEQLKLFEKEINMNSVELKYPRRKSRTITNKKFDLIEPSEIVSKTMKRIPNTGTVIEQIIENELIKNKLNYSRPELLIENIVGHPDFILPKYRIAIFCDGDFWHGKEYKMGEIKNNSAFWDAKIENNILRDEKVTYGLQKTEWKVFRFWESEIKKDSSKCISQVLDYINQTQQQKTYCFNFVDLFAGIGGFRIPLEELGGKCLGFSEIDKNATQVYKKNFHDFHNQEEIELGDITKLGLLPFQNIDLIVGGVPCQSWSVAGKMKGFEDPRGKLWLDTIRLVSLNKPKVFIFENVKGLIDPRNKENLNLIIESFEKVGYTVKKPQLLNSYDFGLPQNRDRIFIIGFRNDLKKGAIKFNYPNPLNKKSFLKDIIDGVKTDSFSNKKEFSPKEIFGDKIPMSRNRFQKLTEMNDFFIFCDTRNGHTTIHSWDIIKTTEREKLICMTILRNRRKQIFGKADGNPLSFDVIKSLINDLKISELNSLVKKNILKQLSDKKFEFVNSKNSSGINGIYRIYLPHSNIFSTLTATGTKDMISLKDVSGTSPEEYKKSFLKEIVKKKLYRPITAKEAGKLQGFPNWFSFHRDEKVAKKQFGNAVSATVILNLSKSLISTGVFNSNCSK